jgi:hypothetical protein
LSEFLSSYNGPSFKGTVSTSLATGINFIGPIYLEPPDAGTIGTSPPLLVYGLTISYTEKVTVTFPVTVDLDLANGVQIVNAASDCGRVGIEAVLGISHSKIM